MFRILLFLSCFFFFSLSQALLFVAIISALADIWRSRGGQCKNVETNFSVVSSRRTEMQGYGPAFGITEYDG